MLPATPMRLSNAHKLVKHCWAAEIWAHVSADAQRITAAGALGREAGCVSTTFDATSVVRQLKENKEVRNITCALTWTRPSDGPACTLALVDKFMRQLYKPNDGAWKIPDIWPRGVNIPISLRSDAELPPKGEWVRFGGDLIVLASWRALALLRRDEKTAEASKLSKLFQAVPFDFAVHAKPKDITVARTHAAERNEMLREFMGNDHQANYDALDDRHQGAGASFGCQCNPSSHQEVAP